MHSLGRATPFASSVEGMACASIGRGIKHGGILLPHQITVLPKTPLFHQRLTRSRVSPDDDDAATDLDSSPTPAPLTPRAVPSPPPADGPARRVGNCRTRHRPPRRPRAG